MISQGGQVGCQLGCWAAAGRDWRKRLLLMLEALVYHLSKTFSVPLSSNRFYVAFTCVESSKYKQERSISNHHCGIRAVKDVLALVATNFEDLAKRVHFIWNEDREENRIKYGFAVQLQRALFSDIMEKVGDKRLLRLSQ